MPVTASRGRLQDLSQGLFQVINHFCLVQPRVHKKPQDLKDFEYLTLSILQRSGSPLIVGDIQRQLGVLPAQMSRILRSLETRDQALIACRINPQDKRKVDVALTAAGVKAIQEYQASRIAGISRLLGKLPEENLEELQRLVEILNDLLVSSEDA